ncbi:hypothetical protein CC79DRAFT_4441 [Sarocladium strictum]
MRRRRQRRIRKRGALSFKRQHLRLTKRQPDQEEEETRRGLDWRSNVRPSYTSPHTIHPTQPKVPHSSRKGEETSPVSTAPEPIKSSGASGQDACSPKLTSFGEQLANSSESDHTGSHHRSLGPPPSAPSLTSGASVSGSPSGIMQYRNPHVWVCTADLLWLKGQVPPHRLNPLERQANIEEFSVWPPFPRDETVKARRTTCEVCEIDKFCLPILRSNQGPACNLCNASKDEMDTSPDNRTLPLPSDFGSEDSYDSQYSEAARIDAQIEEDRIKAPRKRKSDEIGSSRDVDLMGCKRSAKSPRKGAAGANSQIEKSAALVESLLEREKAHLLELCKFGGNMSLRDMEENWKNADEKMLAAVLRESLEKR